MNRCELYLVSDVVESGRIGKLHVGDDQEDICQEIKDFVLNPMKTSKKSKIFLKNKFRTRIEFYIEQDSVLLIRFL